jgi:ribosomal protein S18 acetylase RimI-like enzyme
MPDAVSTLRFRPFAIEDANLLGAWLAAVGLGVPPGVANRNWAERLVHDPHISCWAAQIGSRTVGFFRLDTGPDQQAEITLIVAPGRRRRGVGRRMFDEALRQARRRGLRRILAVVRESNSAALDFFSDAGFDRVGAKTPEHVHLERLVHRAERQPPLEIQP